jgi:chromosome partitioning protein
VGQKPRIIAVANEKGGVGKTVTVINLGAALSNSGKRVLIVDMDPQANATKGLGITVNENMKTVYDLIADSGSIDATDAVVNSQWRHLDVIPSHVDLSGAEVELVDRPGREDCLKHALSELSGDYDYVIIDTPPSLSLLTVNVFAFAGEALVPCQTHPYSFDALAELFHTVAVIRDSMNPNLVITGIVATFFDTRTRVSRRILEKLQADPRYSELLFETVVRTNTTIADSADAETPVVFFNPGSAGAADYCRLSEELDGRKKV